jgi:hypothetical protein
MILAVNFYPIKTVISYWTGQMEWEWKEKEEKILKRPISTKKTKDSTRLVINCSRDKWRRQEFICFPARGNATNKTQGIKDVVNYCCTRASRINVKHKFWKRAERTNKKKEEACMFGSSQWTCFLLQTLCDPRVLLFFTLQKCGLHLTE